MLLLLADYSLLNQVAPMLLAPLFGVPCGLYKLHHVIMHHAVGHSSKWTLNPVAYTVCVMQ